MTSRGWPQRVQSAPWGRLPLGRSSSRSRTCPPVNVSICARNPAVSTALRLRRTVFRSRPSDPFLGHLLLPEPQDFRELDHRDLAIHPRLLRGLGQGSRRLPHGRMGETILQTLTLKGEIGFEKQEDVLKTDTHRTVIGGREVPRAVKYLLTPEEPLSPGQSRAVQMKTCPPFFRP